VSTRPKVETESAAHESLHDSADGDVCDPIPRATPTANKLSAGDTTVHEAESRDYRIRHDPVSTRPKVETESAAHESLQDSADGDVCAPMPVSAITTDSIFYPSLPGESSNCFLLDKVESKSCLALERDGSHNLRRKG
jgi:hypothetical protein